jgi:hypothetical protein
MKLKQKLSCRYLNKWQNNDYQGDSSCDRIKSKNTLIRKFLFKRSKIFFIINN